MTGVREFQAGDEILLLRNDRPFDLRTGTRATIERVHERSNLAMTIITSDGVRHAIPTWYTEAGHVGHGYAMTIHKAQGLTCDQALVYATDDLYQELGYVAMSRGRDINRLYLAGAPSLDLEAADHLRVQERTARQALLGGLSNSRAQELALDAKARGDQRPIERWTVPELIAEKRRLDVLIANAPADRRTDIARLEQRVEDLQRSQRYDGDDFVWLEQRRRPLLDRLRGPDLKLAQAANKRDRAAAELPLTNRELRSVTAAQRSQEKYLDENADAPGLVKRVERIVANRIENAAANDMIETPEGQIHQPGAPG